MIPDWKDAPEWATRLMRSIKVANRHTWVDDSNLAQVVGSDCVFGAHLPDWVEIERRPGAAWDGQGLPPVGTVCEVEDPQSGRWCECLILAWDAELAVFSAGGEYPYQYDGSTAGSFRPIRTAEQIAAEEREVGIAEIRQALVTSAKGSIESTIWDAGYRKQVAP